MPADVTCSEWARMPTHTNVVALEMLCSELTSVWVQEHITHTRVSAQSCITSISSAHFRISLYGHEKKDDNIVCNFSSRILTWSWIIWIVLCKYSCYTELSYHWRYWPLHIFQYLWQCWNQLISLHLITNNNCFFPILDATWTIW